MGGIGQLHQQVTIGTLPDDVLLKIFKLFIDALDFYHYVFEKWRTLVHICRRWRNLAFRYPRHLNLELLFRPSKRSVKEMLDIWPELPIYIWAFDYKTMDTSDNVSAALRLNHRVSGIRFDVPPDSAWETFAPLMQRPFPALTDLWVRPYLPFKNALSRSFLGGSAPRLQDLHLIKVPFPVLPELLLSSTNLVRLWYDYIPPAGYISPQAMVTYLSALTRLESLSLTFLTSLPLPDSAIRIPSLYTRILLRTLTYLRLRGDPEYVEVLVAQIDAPSLESMEIALFHERVLEVPQLEKFVCRADKLSLLDRAKVTFEYDRISVLLSRELEREVDPKTLWLYLSCPESVLQLSYLAQFCASCLPTLSPFESLHIRVPFYNRWEDFIEDPDPQWLELLRLFNTVKKLYLSKIVAARVAPGLRGHLAERVMAVLPALEDVFILT